jgi:hypothetical protein
MARTPEHIMTTEKLSQNDHKGRKAAKGGQQLQEYLCISIKAEKACDKN